MSDRAKLQRSTHSSAMRASVYLSDKVRRSQDLRRACQANRLSEADIDRLLSMLRKALGDGS